MCKADVRNRNAYGVHNVDPGLHDEIIINIYHVPERAYIFTKK